MRVCNQCQDCSTRLKASLKKQKSLEKQLAGLRSFAQQMEKFLMQSAGEGAPAPSEPPNVTRSERERPTISQDLLPGISTSSTGPPSYRSGSSGLRLFQHRRSQGRTHHHREEPSRTSTTHFSTVRSEVRAGAIRIDITNPEQWSAGDTAILRNQEPKQVRDIGKLDFPDSDST